ncbi:MAG: hypothetical protein LC620_07010, partial [Halobacteriales archaeon]|nr:hypothetical protein [Halobacteriales archaeon]
MRNLHVAAVGLAAVIALSGCSGSTDKTTGTTTEGTTPHGTDTAAPGTDTTGPGSHLAHLSVDVRNGTAPLAVAFGVKADGAGPTKWTITFGDGATKDGTQFPGLASHNYTAAGTFVASLTVVYATGNPAQDTLSIGVLGSTPGAPLGYFLNTTAAVKVSASGMGFGCLRG